MSHRPPVPVRDQILRYGLRWTFAMLVGFVFVVSLMEVFTQHRLLLDNLRAQARLIGTNSTAALLFAHHEDGQEILLSLHEEPGILQAAITGKDGQALAEYRRAGTTPCHRLGDDALKSPGVSTRLCGIALVTPIELHGQTLGLLTLEKGLERSWSELTAKLVLGMACAALAFFLSIPIWQRLARHIAVPLLQLAEATKKVRASHDFSQQVVPRGSTEARELAANFNGLMAELAHSSQQVQHELSLRRLAEARLSELAYADSVTLLPNRHYFLERLEQMVVTARPGLQPFALLYLDLDGFKRVNDTLGHDRGDDLLRQVAGRLRATLRSDDVVCRLGGDEFAVILPGVLEAGDCQAVAQALLQAISEPYLLGDDAAVVSASIGGCLCPLQAEDSTALMRFADVAMYRAKALGKRRFCAYLPGMDAQDKAPA